MTSLPRLTAVTAAALTVLAGVTVPAAAADETGFSSGSRARGDIAFGAAVGDAKGDITWAVPGHQATGAGSDIVWVEYRKPVRAPRLTVTMKVVDLNRRTLAGGSYRFDVRDGVTDTYTVALGRRGHRPRVTVTDVATGAVTGCGTATTHLRRDTITWAVPVRCLPKVTTAQIRGGSTWHGAGSATLGYDNTSYGAAVPLR